MDNTSEKIICSAVWYKEFPLVRDDMPIGFTRPQNCDVGIVFCGLRHHNCLYQMVAITGKRQCEMGEEVQGFLTSKNRFVDRKEGWIIAEREKQIIRQSGGHGTLYSEDLY